MYVFIMGEWVRLLVLGIVFLCMFGIMLIVFDGYVRILNELYKLLLIK